MNLNYRKAFISIIVIGVIIIGGFFVFNRQLVPKIQEDTEEIKIPVQGAERWTIEEVGLHNAFVSKDFGVVFQYPRNFGDVIVHTSQLPQIGTPYCDGTGTQRVCAVSFEISFSKNSEILIYGGVPCVGCELEFKYLAGTLLERGTAFHDAFARELPNGGKQVEGRAPFSFPGQKEVCTKDCIYKGQIITTFKLANPYQRITFFGATNPDYYKLVQSVEIIPTTQE